MQHCLWWKKGAKSKWGGIWGRGLIKPDGIVYTWPDEEMTHMERVRACGGDPTKLIGWRFFTIKPDGTVNSSDYYVDGQETADWMQETVNLANAVLYGNPVGPCDRV